MKLSFIIIAYNEELNIEACIDCIFQLESLREYRVEVLAVNDGSQDNTLKLLKKFSKKEPRLKIIDLQPNQGRGAARAAGVAAASGKFMAFVDADIILPKDWLKKCMMDCMSDYDACGGIAVPDGDVAYVYRKCKLSPKVSPHPFAITGSNALFKNFVLQKLPYNPNRRNGEDVDLNYRMQEAGFLVKSVPNLVVNHNGRKSFRQSFHWQFEQDAGASLQFYSHRQLRVPDIAFLGFIVLLVALVLSCFFLNLSVLISLLIVVFYLVLGSLAHLHGKFKLEATPLRAACAILVDSILLLSYYSGRLIGHLGILKASLRPSSSS